MQKASRKDPSPDEILSEAELRAIARHGVVRSYPKNTIVVSEGDRTDTLYIILAGRVRVYVADEHGKDVTLAVQGPKCEYFTAPTVIARSGNPPDRRKIFQAGRKSG